MAQRLFSIFEDANESVLLQQCQNDLAVWGFDSFQCRTFAAEILQEAKAAVATETALFEGAGQSAPLNNGDTQCGHTTDSGNGVTAEDTQWYWNLPPLARAVMHRFDEVIRGHMWFQCHSVNLCIADLERDLRQRLPTFGYAGATDGDDAPLTCPHFVVQAL